MSWARDAIKDAALEVLSELPEGEYINYTHLLHMIFKKKSSLGMPAFLQNARLMTKTIFAPAIFMHRAALFAIYNFGDTSAFHQLEKEGLITSAEDILDYNDCIRCYQITDRGRARLYCRKRKLETATAN